MITVSAKIENNKVVIRDIEKLGRNYPGAVRRGLGDMVKGVFGISYRLLSGQGAKSTATGTAVKERGKWKIKGRKNKTQSIAAGAYPVPVRSDKLRGALGFVPPGKTKSAGDLTFTAGSLQAILYNAAEYARVIHDGLRSSTPYGPRRFMTDAVEEYDRTTGIMTPIEDEVDKELKLF